MLLRRGKTALEVMHETERPAGAAPALAVATRTGSMTRARLRVALAVAAVVAALLCTLYARCGG